MVGRLQGEDLILKCSVDKNCEYMKREEFGLLYDKGGIRVSERWSQKW